MSEELDNLVAELRALVERPVSPWMTAVDVADYLRLSKKSVQNMTGPNAKNPIPFHRLSEGGEKRFHRAEVDGWLTAKSYDVTLASSQTGRHRANGPPPDTGG